MRYMLRSFGIRVEYATPVLGDNKGVLQNCTIDDSTLKKKHVAISYHKSRECAAAGIVHPLKKEVEFNFADICTKFTTTKIYHTLLDGIMMSRRSDKLEENIMNIVSLKCIIVDSGGRSDRHFWAITSLRYTTTYQFEQG